MYKSIATTKKSLRDSRIPEQFLAPEDVLPGTDVADVTGWIESSGQLSVEELQITASDGPTIASNIAARQWTAVDVARAFCHRAVLAHQLTNCLLEVFMEEGFSRAQELDRIYSETGKLVGPLHGVPVLLKDNLNVKGHGTTLGIVGHAVDLDGAEWKAPEDAALVTILRRLGAVLYVKTNVPVAMMMPETNNHVYGNTTNPLNRGLSAGGSSGGEAALLCLQGAPMGVGSDIGGSIRIPASFANVYALRPSLGRFPTYGSRSGLPGLESVSSVNGPMAGSWESLEMYCRAVVGAEPWQYDAKAVPLSWRQLELPPRLNFAVVEDDGIVRPTPPIRRGVRTAADRLRAAGHSVIPWDCRLHREANDIIGQFFLSDGGKHITDATTRATGEPLFPYMAPYGTADDVGVHGLWRLQARRTELMNEMLDQWNASASATPDGRRIDAIIMPASPYAGSPVDKFRLYVGYTSPWNLVDYSVGVVPVARADKNLDPRDDAPAGYGAVDFQVWDDYDPEESHGGAVAVQVVGRRMEEEKVVAMMRVVGEVMGR